MTENEMAGWHHQLDGHESEQTLEDSQGPGNLACCVSWGHKESDMTASEQQCVCVCVCVCACILVKFYKSS